MAPMEKTLAPSQKVTAKDKKGRKFMSIVETAYDNACLSNKEAQYVNDTRGLADLIRNFIAKSRLSREYKGPKPIADQIRAIGKIFDLDPNYALEFSKNLPALKTFVPISARKWTGWFAIPSVNALAAKYFQEVKDDTEKYYHVVQLIHKKITASREFYNWCEGKIVSNHLRVHDHTIFAFDLITEMQWGDILIIAAQLGEYHIDHSVCRAREVFAANEFGLDSVAVGSIVLTHPELLISIDDLGVECAGEEFARNADGDFSNATNFCYNCGGIRYYIHSVNNNHSNFGSASGFLAQ
jgi:hypothetical protein